MGIYARFADLLDYPDVDFPQRLAGCLSATELPGARDALEAFRTEANRLGLERLQETYTSAFDMDADCSLSVGHHLFGENVRRSLFIAQLAADYRTSGFLQPNDEVPDHLPTLLRYVDRQPPGDEARDELLDLAVVPAVRQATQALERRGHPYAAVMRALLAVLCERTAGKAIV